MPFWEYHGDGCYRISLAYESFLLKRFQRQEAKILRALMFCSHQFQLWGMTLGDLISVVLTHFHHSAGDKEVQRLHRLKEAQVYWPPLLDRAELLSDTWASVAPHLCLAYPSVGHLDTQARLFPLCCSSPPLTSLIGPQTFDLLGARKVMVIHLLSLTHGQKLLRRS